MCQLFESIRISEGKARNLFFHNKRMNEARNHLLGIAAPLDLQEILVIPESLWQGIHKCKVLYLEEIQHIEFTPYQYRKVDSLKLVESDNIDYSFKYLDRSPIESLLKERGSCDDILIIKNGLITDTSFANIIFFTGERWVTPSKPLLAGTQRARLLEEGVIVEDEIPASAILTFQKAKIINAFRSMEYPEEIQIRNIL
jgi:4-amino-4-deoxychorismate lyase